MTHRRTSFAAIFLAAGLALAGASAGAQESTPAANSALHVYRFIVNRLAFLEQCAHIDKPNVAAYADAFRAYSLEATPIADRTFAILREEAARAGKNSDYFARSMFDIGRETRARFMDIAEKDSHAFTTGCRGVPRLVQEHRQGFRPIPDLFPDQMREIDEWK
jgi:hypothetical protein